jgi:hypothetical protein
VGSVGPTNDFYISGLGTNEESFGAIRLGTLTSINKLAGRVALTGDARLVGDSGAQSGAAFTGQITGGFNLQFGTDAASFGVFSGSALIISNPTNDWSGDTQLVSSTQLFSRLVLGNNEVFPMGRERETSSSPIPSARAARRCWTLRGSPKQSTDLRHRPAEAASEEACRTAWLEQPLR